jgi:hypothetical protein
MIRRSLLVLLLCCAGGVRCPVFAAAGPACLYESKSYSDGALVCVQKSLMLKCTADGPGASWQTVTDTDLSGHCQAATAAVYAPPSRHFRHWHAVSYRHEPVREPAAKCFGFNGRQYCE